MDLEECEFEKMRVAGDPNSYASTAAEENGQEFIVLAFFLHFYGARTTPIPGFGVGKKCRTLVYGEALPTGQVEELSHTRGVAVSGHFKAVEHQPKHLCFQRKGLLLGPRKGLG
jgi:hypothetical protein